MEYPPSFDDGRPPFDHEFGKELLGKYVLVGLTYVKKSGELIREDQFHGVVQRVDPHEGILLSLRGKKEGEEYNLPPHTAAFTPAAKGEYSLKSTDEVVVNPDFTSTWTIEQPDA